MRKPDQNLLDLGLGRSFKAGPTTIEFDVYVLNTFNDDAHDWWATLVVPPDDEYVADGFVLPRRVMLRLGIRY